MADQRITQATVITDPTTSSQQAAVDASGLLQVDIAADSVGIGGGTQYVQDAAAPATPTGTSIMVERDDALSTLTPIEGDWSHLLCNSQGALWVRDQNTDTNTTDLPNVIGTDGAAGPTKAISIGGTEAGGNLQEILVDANGHLQVDVLTGGGSDTPTNPVIDVADADTPTTIAPATPTNVDSPDLATKKLRMATIASTVPYKVVISTLSGGAATTIAVRTGGPGNDVVWNTPHVDYAVSGTTVAGFRARITNLDPADTADFYVTWAYED